MTKKKHINSYAFLHFFFMYYSESFSSFLFPLPLFHLFFPLPSFTLFLPRTTPHYTRITTHSLTTHTHTTHRINTTHKGTPFSLSLSLFPFVCGVGVVRGMSLGCEWMFCGVGCGVVRVPFPSLLLLSLFPFLFSLVGVCGCVGWVGQWVCVCVGLGVLIDVAAPQRGDQVKQVIYDLAKTVTKNLFIKNVYHHIINQINFVYFIRCVQIYERNSYF